MNLAEIAARAAAATPGPWKYCEAKGYENDPGGRCACGLIWGSCGNYTVATSDPDPMDEEGIIRTKKGIVNNGLFIAHAREDIPALIAEVTKLREENEAYGHRVGCLRHSAKIDMQRQTETLEKLAAIRKAAAPIPTALSAAITILNEAFPEGHNEAPLNECFVAELEECRAVLSDALKEAE